MKKLETRSYPTSVSVETRADGGKKIVGYASVFYREDDPGTEYKVGERFVERVHPTAFSRALVDGDDARGLFNHDSSMILGRVSNGTVRLSVDERGLRYEIDPPDTQFANDVITTIERGDVDGSSFAFTEKSSQWVQDEENQRQIRVLRDVTLYDVGPVVYPAYSGTSSGVRATCDVEELEKSFEKYQARQKRLKELRNGNAGN